MLENRIKKVIQTVYKFDFSNSELVDGRELVVQNNISEFVMAFGRRDLDNGIIVTPSGYKKGFVYKSANDGEIYNHPNWIPDVINFSFNIYGLKRNAFYKLTVISRDTGSNRVITNDRRLVITNDENELLLDEDLTGQYKNKEFNSLFRSFKNEANLFFSVGKIFISDIIIEEVELLVEDELITDEPDSQFEDGKLKLAAYGVFTTQPNTDTEYKGRYLPMLRYSGKGINLYFDTNTDQYVIERDNVEDILGESFTNINYIVDFNFNKVINKGLFSQYNIVDVNNTPSPNTLKQGYIVFEFSDQDDNPVVYKNKDGRMVILIYKLF